MYERVCLFTNIYMTIRLLRAELLSLKRRGALKIGGGLLGNTAMNDATTTNASYTGTGFIMQQQEYSQHVQQQDQQQYLLEQQQQQQQQMYQLEQNNHNLPATTLVNETNRRCARCNTELGRITNRGAPCRVCKLRVCKACREFTTRTTDWVCIVCHKQM